MSQEGSSPLDPQGKRISPAHGCADLHVHTSASDGRLPPAEVIRLAAAQGFRAISISDHDTVGGLSEGFAAAKENGLELIPGVELSTYLGQTEIHILGYCLDYEDASLSTMLDRLCRERFRRIEEMLRLLHKLGVGLDRTKIDRAAADGSVGRLHVARALVEQGFVTHTREAFARYIGGGKPAYVPRAPFSPGEACRMIKQAQGIPVLAHPSLLDCDKLIPRLVKEGIMGVEAFYSKATPDVAEHYRRLAEKRGLLITGGSDCHQSDDEFLLGTVKLDYRYVEKLKEMAAALRVPQSGSSSA